MSAKAAALVRRVFAYVTGAHGIYLFSSLLAKAGTMLLIPLYTRKLTVEAYGDYALAQTIMGAAPVFLSIGTVAAVSTFFFLGSDVEASRRKSGGAARACVVVTLSLGTLAQFAVFGFAEPGVGIGSVRTLSLVLWAGIGTLLGGIPAVYLRAQQKPLKASGYQLFQFVMSIASAYVLVVVLNRGFVGAVESLAWAGVCQGLVGIGFVLFAMPGKLSFELLRETIGFSAPFVAHFASMQLTSISDRWVMKAASRDFDLGTYALAVSVTGPVGMLLGSFNEAESPKMGELMRTEGAAAVQRRFPKVLGSYALVTLVPAIVLVAALPILRLLVGGRFEHALWPVPIIGLVMVLETPFSPSVNVFSYFQRTRVIPVITLSCALLHFGANVLLIPRFGTSGALAARGLAAILRSSILIIVAYDTMRRRVERDCAPVEVL